MSQGCLVYEIRAMTGSSRGRTAESIGGRGLGNSMELYLSIAGVIK